MFLQKIVNWMTPGYL